MSDLIERPRNYDYDQKDYDSLANQAADEIERLTKENERLQRENEALAQKVAELEEKVAALTQINGQIDQKINFIKDLERENEEHIRQINLRNDTIDDLRAELAALCNAVRKQTLLEAAEACRNVSKNRKDSEASARSGAFECSIAILNISEGK